jgi:hypothetical protein
MAGNGISDPILSFLLPSYTRSVTTDEKLLTEPVQDPRHWRGRPGVQNPGQPSTFGIQGYTCYVSRICKDPPRNARKWRRFET